MPEVAPVGFVDSRARTDDLGAAELGVGGCEDVVEVRPLDYVGLDEDGAGGAAVLGGVLVDERLGFGTQGEVGEEDVAVSFEELLGEDVVDAGSCAGDDGGFALDGEG